MEAFLGLPARLCVLIDHPNSIAAVLRPISGKNPRMPARAFAGRVELGFQCRRNASHLAGVSIREVHHTRPYDLSQTCGKSGSSLSHRSKRPGMARKVECLGGRLLFAKMHSMRAELKFSDS
jgi:hypothetical protein